MDMFHAETSYGIALRRIIMPSDITLAITAGGGTAQTGISSRGGLPWRSAR